MSDKCLAELDSWIESQKSIIYDKHFKGIKNGESVLKEYIDELNDMGRSLISAIEDEDEKRIKEFDGLSNNTELLECIKDSNGNTDVISRIEKWLIVFPNTRSSELLDKQILNTKVV